MVVTQSITCLHSAETEVHVRSVAEQDVLHPDSDPIHGLVCYSVLSSGAAIVVENLNAIDMKLRRGTGLMLASGVTLATVMTDAQCLSGERAIVDVEYFRLETGATVYAKGDTAKTLTVTGVSEDGSVVTVLNGGPSDIPLGVNDAIFDGAYEELLLDAGGEAPRSAREITLDAKGRAQFYAHLTRADCLVTGGGLTSALVLTDRMGGWVRGGSSLLNARDYPSIQDAIDALPQQGGTVLIPAGTYDMTETLYTPIDRPCELLGEGGDLEGGNGTVLRWTRSTGMLRIRGDGASVRRMTLHMQASGTPEDEHDGYGVFIGRRNVTDVHPQPGVTESEYHQFPWPISRVTLEDVNILTPAGWGVIIPGCLQQSDGALEHGLVRPDVGDGGGTLAYWITLKRVRVVGARKYGALFTGGACTTITLEGCAFLHQGVGQTVEPTCYAHVRKTSAVTFRDCTFEGTSPSPASGDLTGTSSPWVRVVGSDSVTFDTCYFENDPHYASNGTTSIDYEPQYFIYVATCPADAGPPPSVATVCQAVAVLYPHMVRASRNKGLLRCVYAEDGGVAGLQIAQPYALSGQSLTQIDNPDLLRDLLALRLGSNNMVSVTGSGCACDYESGRTIPLSIGGVPRSSSVEMWCGRSVPVASIADRNAFKDSSGNSLAAIDGMLSVERMGGSSGRDALVYYSGLGGAGWRLANNLPTLTSAARDARGGTWRQGDMILNSDDVAVQVFYANAWHTLASL